MDLKIGSTNTNKIHACTTVISRHISHHQHHQDRGGHGDKCCNRIWVVYVPRVLYRHSSTFRSRWQGARPRMFTPPRCEPGALHPLPAHPASLNCEYMALPCRSAALPLCRHTGRLPRPYAAATASVPQPKVKDEKPPGGAFTRDEERPPCRPLPSAACHGALFSPVGSMARR